MHLQGAALSQDTFTSIAAQLPYTDIRMLRATCKAAKHLSTHVPLRHYYKAKSYATRYNMDYYRSIFPHGHIALMFDAAANGNLELLMRGIDALSGSAPDECFAKSCADAMLSLHSDETPRILQQHYLRLWCIGGAHSHITSYLEKLLIFDELIDDWWSIMECACKYGNLKILQTPELKKYVEYHSAAIFHTAVKYGDTNICEWIISRQVCGSTSRAYKADYAIGISEKMFAWLAANKRITHNVITQYKLWLGDMNYAVQLFRGHPRIKKLCEWAAAGGHLDLMLWLHERGCPLGDSANAARRYKQSKILAWFEERSVRPTAPLSMYVFARDAHPARHGNLEYVANSKRAGNDDRWKSILLITYPMQLRTISYRCLIRRGVKKLQRLAAMHDWLHEHKDS